MKKEAWINKIKENASVLRGFIISYHPLNLKAKSYGDVIPSWITAPQAERACEVVRESIRKESLDCPEIQFDIALQKEDCTTINNLFSAAWFGVPESTSCWQIPGFSIAVDLMDDPVDEDF